MMLNWWIQKRDHNMVRKEAMDFCVIEWTLRLRWQNEKMKRGWETRRGEVIKSHSIMNCLLNSNSLLLHLLQIWSSWMSITNMAESWVFWTTPILINPPWAAFFRSVRQVGTRGWKGIRPLCHVGPPSSLTSYGRATWVGNECTRLEKEKKKKMLVPQEEERDKGGRDWGLGGR